MTEQTFKVFGLKAENVLNLEFVEIDTGGKSVTLVGPNGAGKTNVFESILLGMGWKGKKDIPYPIRNGQKSGNIELDLGDIMVKRRLTPGGSSLVVENKEGLIYKSPQTLLNGFRQKISFDPMEFISLPEKQQKEILLGLIDLPIDLDEQDRNHKKLYDERTIVNRGITQLTGQMEGIQDRLEIPDEELSAVDVMDEQKTALEEIAKNNKLRMELETIIEKRREIKFEQDRINAKIIEFQDMAEQIKINMATADHTIATMKDVVDNLVDPDIEVFKCAISDLEITNSHVREKKERRRLLSIIADEKAKSIGMTVKMTAIDELKDQTIRDANMPISGLGFDDVGITFESIPLKQRSSGEQTKIATAIYMVMNPKLRVIWIQNASLLDDEHMSIIKEMAEENGYQLWLERVEHEGEIGIHINEGRIVS